MMAERTMDAVAFMDFCAFMQYPQADVVRGIVEDYGYDQETAELAVRESFDRRRELDEG